MHTCFASIYAWKGPISASEKSLHALCFKICCTTGFSHNFNLQADSDNLILQRKGFKKSHALKPLRSGIRTILLQQLAGCAGLVNLVLYINGSKLRSPVHIFQYVIFVWNAETAYVPILPKTLNEHRNSWEKQWQLWKTSCTSC